MISQILRNRLYHFPRALLAVLFYRNPAKGLFVIGVTGTDGKTTTASLIHHCLNRAGHKVALITTVSAKIEDKEISTGFHVTSPDPWQLQKLLRVMKDKKMTHVVIEATSHGLDQYRLFGINFKVAVLTNVTHEHLDYHHSYQNYLRAKSKLFEKAEVAVLNKDDESFLKIERFIPKETKVVTYAINKDADFTPQKFIFNTKLIGEYNQYNCLAAIAAVSSMDIPPDLIKESINDFAGVSGRMEKIELGQNFSVFIDFAHTPNALKNVLTTVKRCTKGKVIVVFGCAGLRDRAKRPIMGEIASSLADTVILTAEDPRTERVEDIIAEIAERCPTYVSFPDRREAIMFALKQAGRDDTVIICGKGHERSMCFGTKEFPWNDKQVAVECLGEVLR